MASSKRHRSRRSSHGRSSHQDGAPGRLAAWWRARPGWQQHALCLLMLVLAALLFFAPVHFSGGDLSGGDTVNWRAQAEAMIEYKNETGREALWNSNVFGGMPGYMISYSEQVPQLDAVPSALRSFLWPTSHFIFLLFGTYGLVFSLTENKGAALLSSVAFGTTTYLTIILGAGHNTKFIALCFAPWMAWAFAWALRRPRWLSALAFAIALAVNLRASHVQITYYLTFLLGVWWVVELVGAVRKRHRDGRLASFGWATGALALGSLLGLMMVAQPYLVYAEYKGYTIRGDDVKDAGESGMGTDYAMRWSQGVGELTTLAVADAYGGSSGERTYWGPKPFTEGPHYVGGIVLFLALLAAWKVHRNVVRAFAIGAFVMTLFALGRHFALLNDLMYAHFPLFDAFRAPETWISMVAFALAVLAGFGADYAGQRVANRQEEKERARALYASAGGVAAFVAVLLVGAGTFFDYGEDKAREQVERQLQAQVAQRPNLTMGSPRVQQVVDQQVRRYMQEVRPEREDKLTGDALRTLLFLALAIAALWAYRRSMLSWPLAAGALVLLVGLDLGGVARRHLSEDTLAESGDPEDQIQQYGADRFIQEQQREAGGKGRFRVLSLADRGGPMNSGRASYFHESLGGYHGAKLRRYQDFIDHVYRDPQTGLPNENALDLLSARYVIAPSQAAGRLPGTRVVYPGEGRGAPAVLENIDALPRAFFVGETEIVRSAEAMWERLRSPSFNPRRTALLPAPLENFETTPLDSSSTAPSTAPSTARVELQEYSPREIVWQVETNAPRLMVASEVYYPKGWTATLDGEPVEIHRVDYLLRGVAVPEGEHRLVMRFAPQRHRAGLWISGVSTALVYGAALLLVGRLVWRRREEGKAEEEDEQAAASA
jgi:hypothetical protein